MNALTALLSAFISAIHLAASNTIHFAVLARDHQTPVEKSAAISTQVGAGLALFGGFTINEWAAIIGVFIGIASFAFNVYISFRRLEIEKQAAQRNQK